jgi:hypothetical protein
MAKIILLMSAKRPNRSGRITPSIFSRTNLKGNKRSSGQTLVLTGNLYCHYTQSNHLPTSPAARPTPLKIIAT